MHSMPRATRINTLLQRVRAYASNIVILNVPIVSAGVSLAVPGD
jgi:hypothetical protein